MATSTRTAPLTPARAALSWTFVSLIALGGLLSLLWAIPNLPGDRLGEVALFFVIAGASQRMPVSLFRNSSISVGFALGFAALVYLGPAAGIVVQLAPGLVLCVTPYVKPAQKMLFNAGSLPLQTALAGVVYTLLGGPVGVSALDAGLLVPTLGATAAFVALNTVCLAVVIALETGSSVKAVWILNYRWLLPNYVALGVLGLGMAAAMRVLGLASLAVFAIPLAMAWYSFRLYMASTREVRKRNEELARANAALDLTNARLSQRVTELQALNKIGLSLTGSLDLGNVLGEILDSALALVPGRAAAVALADPATGRLALASSVGLATDAAQALTAVDGPAARALAGREVVSADGLIALPLAMTGDAAGVLAVTFEANREVSSDERLVLTALAQQAATAIHNARLHQEIEASYLSTVQAMVQVTDARERYTSGHAERVRAYCAAAASHLGLDDAQKTTLELAALFHDLGHVGVPESVLNKPGELSAEEWALVRRHPTLGVSILKQVPRMEAVVPVILQHHERYDGQGYPAGLLGDDASHLAQILAVADAYEAMTSARPHRSALSADEAAAELARHRGTQFAPRAVDALLAAVEQGVQTEQSSEPSLLRLLRPSAQAI